MRVGMGPFARAGDRIRKGGNIEITISRSRFYSIASTYGSVRSGRQPRGPWTAPRDDGIADGGSCAGARSGRGGDRLRGRRAGLASTRAARSVTLVEKLTLWPAPRIGRLTTSRTDSSASRAGRSTKPRRPRSSIAPPRPGGPDAHQGHAPLQPHRGRRASPAHLRRAVVQRPAPRPAGLRASSPARRQW